MWRAMIRKLLFSTWLVLFLTMFCIALLPQSTGYAKTIPVRKPALALNRRQGPLGVTLTLRGTNFPAGQANLSYIDAMNVPGLFAPPSDSSVEVLPDGSFLTTNLVLPTVGPAGAWKIVVTDNNGALNTIRYTVLVANGNATAGAPTLLLTLPASTNPANADPPANTSGSSNAIMFSGTNWLPKGTAVKLTLSAGAVMIPLLEPAPVSDAQGDITGSFYLPTTISVSNATVLASDEVYRCAACPGSHHHQQRHFVTYYKRYATANHWPCHTNVNRDYTRKRKQRQF